MRHRDDLLHLVWLGLGKDIGGQLLYDFGTSRVGDLNDNLKVLHREMRVWFRSRSVKCTVRQFSKATVSWSSSHDYPTFETKMKAAECKMVCLWLAWKAVDVIESDGSEYCIARASMAWSFSEVIRIFDASGLFLSVSDAEAAQRHGNNCLVLYQKLAAQAVIANECAYKLRPKWHYFSHMLAELTLTRENPKRQDCFSSEDYIGRIKKIGSKCHRSSVSLRVVQRLVMLLGLRWAASQKVAQG